MVEAERPAAVRMTDAVSSIEWKPPIEKVQPVSTLRRLLAAAAVGAALKPVPGLVRDRLADSVETLKSKAS